MRLKRTTCREDFVQSRGCLPPHALEHPGREVIVGADHLQPAIADRAKRDGAVLKTWMGESCMDGTENRNSENRRASTISMR